MAVKPSRRAHDRVGRSPSRTMSWSALRLTTCRGKFSRVTLSFSSRETMLSSLRMRGNTAGWKDASIGRSSCCKAGAHASLGHQRLGSVADDNYSISHYEMTVFDLCLLVGFPATHPPGASSAPCPSALRGGRVSPRRLLFRPRGPVRCRPAHYRP